MKRGKAEDPQQQQDDKQCDKHTLPPPKISDSAGAGFVTLQVVNFADYARTHTTRYTVNVAFTRATLDFTDGSHLEFEHTSRSNRWARASADGTIADEIGRTMRQFRLNAKHLQLFFEDGSDVEFLSTPSVL